MEQDHRNIDMDELQEESHVSTSDVHPLVDSSSQTPPWWDILSIRGSQLSSRPMQTSNYGRNTNTTAPTQTWDVGVDNSGFNQGWPKQTSSNYATTTPIQTYDVEADKYGFNHSRPMQTLSNHGTNIVSTTQFQTTSQPYIVTTQPQTINNGMVTPTVMTEKDADSAWLLGFVTCFCCCLPIGVGALYMANEAGTNFRMGNIEQGMSDRRCSYMLSMLGMIIGVIVVTVSVVVSTQV